MRPCRYSSILLVTTISLIICCTVSAGISAGNQTGAPNLEDIRRMVEAGLNENYDLADSLAVAMQQEYPDHPIGYVMQAVMLQGRMLDFEYNKYEDEFYNILDSSEKRCEILIRDDPDNPWPYYCLGLGYGSKAVYHARKGSWWPAMRHGMKSKNAFEKCIELDSTFYDAYVGLGSYHYWRTVKTKLVNWLPLVQDDRREGISELNIAIEKGRFSADFARNALMWILIDMKDYNSAESLAVEMNKKYSGGRKFLWGIIAARLAMEDYSRAESPCLQLLKRTQALHDDNGYNEIECMYNLALIYEKTMKYQQSIDICEKAESISLTDDLKKRLRKKLKEIHKIREKASKALKKHGM